MANTSNAGNDDAVKHISVKSDVFCECRDGNNSHKSHRIISIRFVLAVEFACPGCKNLVIAKVEIPAQKVVCPVCGNCEFTLTDAFDKLLESAKRSTPHRTPSRRISSRQNSNRSGRPSLDGVRREPTQITLHPDTIDALYKLDVSRGELFEFLLNFFPPFTNISTRKTQE